MIETKQLNFTYCVQLYSQKQSCRLRIILIVTIDSENESLSYQLIWGFTLDKTEMKAEKEKSIRNISMNPKRSSTLKTENGIIKTDPKTKSCKRMDG